MNQGISKHVAASWVADTLPIPIMLGKYLRLARELDNHFVNPREPTVNELTLFELQNGECSYKSTMGYWNILGGYNTKEQGEK